MESLETSKFFRYREDETNNLVSKINMHIKKKNYILGMQTFRTT